MIKSSWATLSTEVNKVTIEASREIRQGRKINDAISQCVAFLSVCSANPNSGPTHWFLILPHCRGFIFTFLIYWVLVARKRNINKFIRILIYWNMLIQLQCEIRVKLASSDSMRVENMKIYWHPNYKGEEGEIKGARKRFQTNKIMS